jgi:thiol-disulfide isomerase/thioredoxin
MSLNRRHGLTALVGVLAAAAGAAGWWWPRRQAPEQDTAHGAEPSSAVWALRLPRPGGGELNLASYQGKPVVLNFWATWCPPCVKELPDLDTFAQEQGPNGWEVIAIAIDSPSAVVEFLKKTPLRLPVGLAGFEGTALAKSLGNASGSLPFTVLLDRQGRIVERHLGQTSLEQLRKWAQRTGT